MLHRVQQLSPEGLRQAGVANPLMLLDEIDKVSSDYKGDTSSALLEVLDGEQNVKFRDHYVEVPVDLSQVLFIATANTTQTIPGPLLDRMELIEVNSYTENEKFHIARDYLVAKQMGRNGLKDSQITFSDKSLEKIIHNYQLLEESNKQINVEQEKLLRHFHYSDEGIAIFSANREKLYANTHFIQYLNIILDEPTFKVEKLLEQPDFKELNEFLQKNTPVNPNTTNIPVYQNKISKGGKHFAVKLLIFTDNSFEITLNNISDNEKNRLLKQEMTNNIAHELKTPVSSIRGYIETLLEQPNITPDKQHFFLERTYSQIVRLSDLIRDIALITKTEEASELFDKERVNVHNTLQEVIDDLHDPIIAHGINVRNEINPQTVIEGNKTLVYAIFRNLIENSINYAGDNISIGVNNYMEDNEFYYFSYYDTGQGIEENHLNRIFERFYRVCEGRSRQNGGSGLGLSIVKNAVLFHKGDISAKNRKDGGLEFLFSLKKTLF